MTGPLAFVDVETLGLDPHRHVLWEWAVVLEDGTEYHGQVRVSDDHLAAAQPAALELGGFHARYDHNMAATAADAGYRLARILDDVTLVGAQPHFDAAFLRRLLCVPADRVPWHHRLLDVESYAAGVLGWPTARSLSDTARAVGIEVDGRPRHTALDDARLAREVYDAVLDGVPAGVW